MGDQELLQEVRERLVRVETKMDHILADRDRLEQVTERARDAYSLSQENARAIAEIKADDRRKWGVMIGMGTTFIVSVLMYFLAK